MKILQRIRGTLLTLILLSSIIGFVQSDNPVNKEEYCIAPFNITPIVVLLKAWASSFSVTKGSGGSGKNPMPKPSN